MHKSLNRLTTAIVSLALALFLISLTVKTVLAFRQLYYFDIEYLKIAENYNMSKEEIIKNYNILIDYIQDRKITKLSMPSFKVSREGEIHFAEVKNIFMNFNSLLYITGFLSLIGVIYKVLQKNFLFLKWSFAALISIPVALSIPFAINFDKSFTAFHKIFFNNDYWEFDPISDPIINVLPQEFFFHCAVMILVLIALFSIILYFIYRKTMKNTV
ncbi:TIGR01906 family membrane protein [Clostridium sp. SYSU_GA19001]|uniref:TIGR01906 family membrane protein n=1 Tax=Clostridium caldaquaticum TaxID=2940653 RepID=UPI0020778E52|nr:TIGR01906 family membrane protein [Clostridium caldaquaticum]MCM8711501.1 TIGR01906 family membrane protein [Clostridium caldaquaticum]